MDGTALFSVSPIHTHIGWLIAVYLHFTYNLYTFNFWYTPAISRTYLYNSLVEPHTPCMRQSCVPFRRARWRPTTTDAIISPLNPQRQPQSLRQQYLALRPYFPLQQSTFYPPIYLLPHYMLRTITRHENCSCYLRYVVKLPAYPFATVLPHSNER